MHPFSRVLFSVAVCVGLLSPSISFAQYGSGSSICDKPGVTCVDSPTLPMSAQENIPTLNIPPPTAAQMAESNAGAQAMDDLKQCQDAQTTNAKACGDPNSTAGMNGGEQAQLMQGLGMVSMIGAQAAAAQGSAKACMLASTLSAALQGLSLLKANTCQKTINNCSRICGQAKESEEKAASAALAAGDTTTAAQRDTDARKAKNIAADCQNNNSKVQAMTTQMMMLGMSAMNALSCKSQSSDSDSALTALPTATPAALTTAVGDCSDASFAATSTYCICKANPSDALCANGTAGIGGAGTGGLATGGVTTPGVTTGADDEGELVNTDPVKSNPEAGKQAGGGGGGGGGGFGAGGGGGLNPEGGDGTSGSGINKDVITGQSGASGGGLGAVAGGGGGGGMGSRGGGSGSGSGSGFNLAKYLPKNMFKNRGLAGMTVPARDGVTGPLGPSIWEKVHTRYEDKKATLIQDK